jgi:glutamate/tyrosine decarboxylase-like PLP-dependent enzyme
VEGQDFTLSGSRSGANAVAVWMILSTYGKFGWFEKIYVLQKRTDWLCEKLDEIGIEYYRNKLSNIVTMKADQVGKMISEKFGLVPDDHHNPSCYKVVVMDHVEVEKLQLLVNDIAAKR